MMQGQRPAPCARWLKNPSGSTSQVLPVPAWGSPFKGNARPARDVSDQREREGPGRRIRGLPAVDFMRPGQVGAGGWDRAQRSRSVNATVAQRFLTGRKFNPPAVQAAEAQSSIERGHQLLVINPPSFAALPTCGAAGFCTALFFNPAAVV